MAKNSNLSKAKKAKNDEFYTRREDIERELSRGYEKFFYGKTVYCNCDDPEYSEFWQFFKRVFKPWKLKKLIATHYEPDEANYAYMLELSEDTNGDGKIDYFDEPIKRQIPCNGDFRNGICIELLKEADIVVTNPPFSLFREYVAQLMEYEKDFVIVGPMNALTYKEVFPLIKEGKIWSGCSHPKMFRLPDGVEGKNVEEKDGIRYQKFGNVQWFTNLDITKRHEKIDLRGNYYSEEKYPKYDNYDAIEVSRVCDIPCDYDGVMGVPITFLDNYSPNQFEIIGCTSSVNLSAGMAKTPSESFMNLVALGKARTGGTPGKAKPCWVDKEGYANVGYHRVLIRNLHPEPRRTEDIA